jgi:hypothetical protein
MITNQTLKRKEMERKMKNKQDIKQYSTSGSPLARIKISIWNYVKEAKMKQGLAAWNIGKREHSAVTGI